MVLISCDANCDINIYYRKCQPGPAARSPFVQNCVYKIGSEETNYVIVRSLGPTVYCCVLSYLTLRLLRISVSLVPIIACNPNISLHVSSWNTNKLCRLNYRSYRTFCRFVELNTQKQQQRSICFGNKPKSLSFQRNISLHVWINGYASCLDIHIKSAWPLWRTKVAEGLDNISMSKSLTDKNFQTWLQTWPDWRAAQPAIKKLFLDTLIN